MQATVEILWQRERKRGDLGAAFTDHFVRKGAVVVDVGASFGLFSYHLARLVGRTGTVYSFEPHPSNRVVLEKLAKARPAVRFRPVAISDEPGSAEMRVPVFGGRHVTAQSSLANGFGDLEGVAVQSVSVPTVRLDDELGDRPIDFIKIDVEGHEIAVLKGASGILRKHLPPMLIEIEQRHLDYPIADVFAEITGLGYELFFIDGPKLSPIDEFDIDKHQLFAVSPHEFTPFSMPEGYVVNFCAVAKADMLSGIPGFAV
jgi:FkbM family methyltransferase